MRRTLPVVAVVAAATAGAAWWMCSVSAIPESPVALVIRLVDAVTGEPVQGGTVLVGEGNAPLPATPDGTAFRREDSGLRRSEWCRIAVSVEAVPGHAIARPVVDAFVGTFTDVAELTIPLRPTIDVTVEVRDGAGSPVQDAEFFSALVGDRFEEATFGWPRRSTDAYGRLVVRGVPFVAGARLRAAVRRGDTWGQGEARFGDRPAGDVLLPVELVRDKLDADMLRAIYAMGGGNGPGPRTPRHGVRPSGDAAIVVTLLRSDGAPHVGVVLALCGSQRSIGDWRIEGATDDAGRVEFHGVPAGPCSLNAWGRGLGPEDRDFEAVAGETMARTLHESTEMKSVVTVLDADGHPVPGAWVDARFDRGGWGITSSRFVVQEEDGTQRLLPATGPDGRVQLSGLPAGRVGLRIERFSRSVFADVVAGEDATITLPDVR